VEITAEARLMETMPDLLVALQRDGTVLSFGGGRAVSSLMLPGDAAGKPLQELWPKMLCHQVLLLVRKAIASRRALDAEVVNDGLTYHVRISPQGPGRALCMLRAAEPKPASGNSLSATGTHLLPYADRRGFLQRFEDTVAVSMLSEKPVALIAIVLDGVEEIASLDAKMGERVVTAALMRLSAELTVADHDACSSIGQLTESQLAFVVETDDRRTLDVLIGALMAILGAPLILDETHVTLTCFAGVALLGRDASTTRGLLDCARLAAGEARRDGTRKARFFSDTMKMKSLARMDVARELREAISSNAIRARYVGRHDLRTGRRVCLLAYAQWRHALRGEIPAKEFIAVADATGASVALSRAILRAVARDFDGLSADIQGDARVSYGPLRQHVLHEEFMSDIKTFLCQNEIPVGSFEIRIAEATFVALPPQICEGLKACGVRIVVDEVGRGVGSLERSARAPLWGMQLDRSLVAQLQSDDLARRMCGAGIAMAVALGIEPIAMGVDGDSRRVALLELGCLLGSGDLYAPLSGEGLYERRVPR
jgi:predicted signal transduction protein with EAL and GGDEF domain